MFLCTPTCTSEMTRLFNSVIKGTEIYAVKSKAIDSPYFYQSAKLRQYWGNGCTFICNHD